MAFKARLSLVAGVDPKSIVCEHFRHGQCTKGHKCKYSHDLNVERKTAKAAVFDEEEGKEVRSYFGTPSGSSAPSLESAAVVRCCRGELLLRLWIREAP